MTLELTERGDYQQLETGANLKNVKYALRTDDLLGARRGFNTASFTT
jgi:hypothetical protein